MKNLCCDMFQDLCENSKKRLMSSISVRKLICIVLNFLYISTIVIVKQVNNENLVLYLICLKLYWRIFWQREVINTARYNRIYWEHATTFTNYEGRQNVDTAWCYGSIKIQSGKVNAHGILKYLRRYNKVEHVFHGRLDKSRDYHSS